MIPLSKPAITTIHGTNKLNTIMGTNLNSNSISSSLTVNSNGNNGNSSNLKAIIGVWTLISSTSSNGMEVVGAINNMTPICITNSNTQVLKHRARPSILIYNSSEDLEFYIGLYRFSLILSN